MHSILLVMTSTVSYQRCNNFSYGIKRLVHHDVYRLSLSLVLFVCNHYILFLNYKYIIGASVSEPHLRSSTRPLSVYIYIYIYIYISYVRHFWSRGPRATRKRKPAHLKFKGHMHACCIYVANTSRPSLHL